MSNQVEKYITLSGVGEAVYKEKGSRFLAFAFPVADLDEVKIRLIELKAKYHDARHHCYAYVLGIDRTQTRANDDGEPNHSAGDPILGQIHSHSLTNTLIVVVRYFGGTKLGVGGLIYAYKTAADEAIKSTKKIEVEVTLPLELIYGYDETNEVMRLVSDYGLSIVDQEFKESCSLKAEAGILKKESLRSKVDLLNDTGHKIELKFFK